jgi:hypothetical protein
MPRLGLLCGALVGALAIAGCGEATTASNTVTVTKTTTAPAPTTSDTQPTAHARSTSPRGSAQSSLRSCDANIRAKAATTTCPFAENVFYGYWLNRTEPGVFADSPGIPAYSKAAGTMIDANCSGASKIVCKAADGSYVTFPARAVAAYTVEQAKAFAQHQDLGDVPPPSESAPPPSDPGIAPDPGDGSGSGADGSATCDPNYEGQCLDPNSFDYDCEGSSGNGPDYTGPVTVVGDDHFGLDRDGDGLACES